MPKLPRGPRVTGFYVTPPTLRRYNPETRQHEEPPEESQTQLPQHVVEEADGDDLDGGPGGGMFEPWQAHFPTYEQGEIQVYPSERAAIEAVLFKNRNKIRVIEREESELVIIAPAFTAYKMTAQTLDGYDSYRCLLGTLAREKSHPSQQDARINPFFFLKVKLMLFQDGFRFWSCCGNPTCERCKVDADKVASAMETSVRTGEASADVLPAVPKLCMCAQLVLKVLFGAVGEINLDHDLEAGSMAALFVEQDSFSMLHHFLCHCRLLALKQLLEVFCDRQDAMLMP